MPGADGDDNRMGRKPVFMLALVGSTANVAWILAVAWIQPWVPIRLIWMSSAGALVGGGGAMLTAIFFSMLTDVLPESQRYGHVSPHPRTRNTSSAADCRL